MDLDFLMICNGQVYTQLELLTLVLGLLYLWSNLCRNYFHSFVRIHIIHKACQFQRTLTQLFEFARNVSF